MNMKKLPSDCKMLPLFEGALLVSREHAVFCKIDKDQVGFVSAALAGQRGVDILDESLKEALKKHGFFSSKQNVKKRVPTVQLQLTNACNIKCTYCCTNSLLPRKEELSKEGFAKVILDVRKHLGKGASVSFLGGEPFLLEFTTELARLALEQELKLTIFSNGIVLDENEKMLREVAQLTQKGALLKISLAGMTRETCDDLSGAIRYEKAINVLNRLDQYGGKANVDIMLMPQNWEEMAREFYIFKKKVPSSFKISLGILYLSGRENGEHLFASKQEQEDILTQIAFEAGETIPAPAPEPIMQRRDACDCAMGFNLNVRSDGGLFHCFKMEEKIGHIKEMSIFEALEKISNNPHPASTLETCKDCSLNTLCGGGCRSDNFLYTNSGEPLCGPWRVRIISELLAQDRIDVVEWSFPHLYAEAKARGLEVPESIPQVRVSQHCIDV